VDNSTNVIPLFVLFCLLLLLNKCTCCAQQIIMKVTLRKRKRSGGKESYYLDLYENGRRRNKSLDLFIWDKTEVGRLSAQQKYHNKETEKSALQLKPITDLKLKMRSGDFRVTISCTEISLIICRSSQTRDTTLLGTMETGEVPYFT